MGQYNKAVLTLAGENLIARTLAGEIQLIITKAKTSNYIYPAGTDFKSLTDMQGIKQTATDPTTAVYDNTMIQTRALFSNEEILSTYYIQNIGLYAMDGTEEVLFCIVTAETPDEMPQYSGVASTSFIYNIQNVVQDAAELNISVNPSGTATIQDVMERVDATGGDISETVIGSVDTVEDKYPIPTAGESVKRFFGKVLTFLRSIRPLTGDINIYVSTTGSDTTGDGSELNPFRTIQYSINIIPKDLGTHKVIITVANGTYDEDIFVDGFRNGDLSILSVNKDTLVDTCKVNSVLFYCCGPVYVRLNGFNMITTTKNAIQASKCDGIYIDFCQSITNAGGRAGIQCYESSNIRIANCRMANKNHAAAFINSSGHSVYWDAGSTGNQVGISSYNGSVVTVVGTQPNGTTLVQHGDGGTFINDKGTQITGVYSTGLSCTWGDLSGGYITNGLSGSTMVTIVLTAVLLTDLSAWTAYYISGFPRVAGTSRVAISVHDKTNVHYCFMNSNGILEVSIKNPLVTGQSLMFNCTYMTDL
ncbi:hypothetical protein [Lacrimispora sp.]|uniref:hypothetical protein n=1 Tax=Lacrimispora sp. TaxID=2719234 RepID=UPI0029E2D824|nr:hypothetical protein [Lacrimispora sp.]